LYRHINEYVEDWDYDTDWDGSKDRYIARIVPLRNETLPTGVKLHAVAYAQGDFRLNGTLVSSTDVPGGLRGWSPTEDQANRLPSDPGAGQTGGTTHAALIDEQDLNNLVSNALFSINTDPDHPYLVESRYAFADWQGFHGSEYMLDRVG